MTSPGQEARRFWAWLPTCRRAYNHLLDEMDAYENNARNWTLYPAVIQKVQQLRQWMNHPDGVRLPGGQVRLKMGEPGVSPLQIRDWINQIDRNRGQTPWLRAARAYLNTVREEWAEIPEFIRTSGGGLGHNDHHVR
jgi:hypothetical protein